MNDDLDRMLDGALRGYVEEPRVGLEGRVLADVQARRAGRRWFVAWAASGLAAVAILLLGVFWPVQHEPIPVAKETPPAQEITAPPAAVASVSPPAVARPVNRRSRAKAEPLRKEEVFPARAPLTEEERALVALVALNPKQDGERVEFLMRPAPEQLAIDSIQVKPLDGDREWRTTHEKKS